MTTVLRLTARLIGSFATLLALVSATGGAFAPPGLFAVGGFDCASPCWQGIVPGVTTAHEALDLLERSAQVEPGSVRSLVGDDSFGVVQWQAAGHPSERRWRGQARVSHGVVVSLRLPASDVQLGDLMAALGSPQWVRVLFLDSGQAYADIRYTAQGVRMIGFAQGHRYLSPKLPAVEVLFLPRVRSRDGWIPWQGFGLARYALATVAEVGALP